MRVYLGMLFLVVLFSILMSQRRIYSQSNTIVKYDDLGQILFIFCTSVLVIVAGFRWFVGTDYGGYFWGYGKRVREWYDYLIEFNEPGLSILAKIASLIYDNPVTMFFLASLITVVLYANTIKKYSNDFLFSMCLYIFVGSWHGPFNGVRQYLAAAVLFAGHRFIYEKKLFKYILVVLVAMAFHRTAIIMLPIYFLVGKRFTWKNIGVVAIVVALIRFSYDSIFATMSYFKGSDVTQYDYMNTDVNLLRICVALAPVLIAIYMKKRVLSQDPETQMYIMLLTINAGLSLATQGSAYLARGGIYTETYMVFAIPKLLKCFNKGSRQIAILLVCGCYFIYWLYSLRATGVMNYNWCFGNM